ncbi:hypothetical protein PTSG_12378 [Salpingoeca rosetta]|uniref:PCI domain-containing protein n=1 Tax=Salpingoeca rosetta (strain ATCC 50818 / BSB-021) TaxID=946362 RepID=F2UDD9_SALR5|nr:uncharacterized protein PTSG_12378 [Salpingoeca rosetta]EGD74634.1 hypothetical protein PTSG_12378 [Salpingoeca rosetta]|eukprot:XP_004992891.1 hypothetical protein PTSG_12378 [Salpingoeca rosetta]
MAEAYIEKQLANARGDDEDVWKEVQTLHNRKLWHQLSVKITEMLSSDLFASGGMVELHDSFIVHFYDRINLQTYAKMCLTVATQYESPHDALAFFEQCLERVSGDALARVCIISAMAELHLLLNQTDVTKAKLKEAEALLEEQAGVTEMHANFYRVAAEYYKNQGVYHEFYTNALRYLGCIELDTLGPEQQVQRAFDLALAAILGKGVYNFGELLAHPILESLRSTSKEWLIDLLYAFNSGDLAKFEFLQPQWGSDPDLKANESVMQEKIRLLALMEMVFRAPANNRRLAFDAIGDATKTPVDQVEMLVMKALSLGLVRGSLDEVDSVAVLTWVQPRVLSQQQVEAMATRFNAWTATVDQTASAMETRAPELYAL